MPRGRAKSQPQVPFAHKLVLNQWLMSLFNVRRFEDLAENNIHYFHHALTARLFDLTQLPTELLLEFDQNIVKHTLRLNERRITRGEDPIVWKYFQYLTLLFTEIYLHLGPTDPKIEFHETIKEIEQRLGDPTVQLQSFIVSNTPSATMRRLWSMEKREMQKRHVLFQEEDKDSYVRSMLEAAVAGGAA